MVALLVLSAPVLAQEDMVSIRYQSSPGDYYQVMFDAEGEASVLVLLERFSTQDQMDSITIEIPGQVDLRYAFQEVPTCAQECVRYLPKCINEEIVCSDANWDSSKGECSAWTPRCVTYSDVCVEYQEICRDWPKAYALLKFDAERLSKSTRYVIHLDKSIPAASTGKILLYYKATGYVSSLVNYDFDFETIKSAADVEQVRVAISLDSEMYLRGSGTSTDYVPSFRQIEAYAYDAASGSAKSSEALMNQANNIMWAQGYVKTKSALDPWESFHVYGTYNYANLWFLTYIWEIVIFLVALVVFKAFLWKPTSRKIGEAFGKKTAEKKTKEKPKEKKLEVPGDGRFTRVALAGLVSALLTMGLAWLVFNFLTPLSYAFGYPFSFFFGIIILIVSGALMLLALGGPSIWMWRRYGIAEGALTFVSTIIWMFILLVLIATLITPTQVVIGPYYGGYMETIGSVVKGISTG